jgi:hypothetical protein
MMRSILQQIGAAICILLLSAPLIANEKSNSTPATTAPGSVGVAQSTWPPETLKGTVVMVEADQHLIIVKSPDGVTFALKLTNSTRIQSGEQKLRSENLNLLMDKTVSVRFRPTRSGNVATAVQVLSQE